MSRGQNNIIVRRSISGQSAVCEPILRTLLERFGIERGGLRVDEVLIVHGAIS
jgi:hypothetical protein